MNTFKKSLALILIISFVVPAGLLTNPKKAEAADAASCWATFFGALALQIGINVSLRTSIPVNNDMAGSKESSGAQGLAHMTQECIIKPLVKVMVKTLVRKFTQDIVTWINSGFQGNPGFVTNPEGFFREVGDIAAGNIIETIAPTFCGPFSLQLKFSLGFYYSALDETGCRLSDVQNNLQNAFINGNFINGGGWNSWLSMNQNPNNNIFGAYIQASDLINLEIIKKTNNKLRELAEGGGFLSWRDCIRHERKGEEEDPDGRCLEEGPVKTPGKVIETQVNNAVGWPLEDAHLAESIDGILTALVGQMINQVFTATGLAGGHSTPSYDNSAYRQAVYNSIYNGTSNLPAGISASICSTFNRSETYSIVDGAVKITRTSGIVSTIADAMKNTIPPAQWSVQDFYDVSYYCGSREYANVISAGINNATAISAANIFNGDRNLAIRAQTSQSSNYKEENSSDKAVDGIAINSAYIPSAITASENNPWWQVTLNNASNIKEVGIYKRSNVSYSEALGTFIIIVYDENQNTVWTSGNIETSPSSPIPIKVPVNKRGKFLRIQRFGNTHLQLAEVEVVGNENVSDESTAQNNIPEIVAPFAIAFDPAIASTANTQNGSAFENSFGVSANGAKTGLKITMKLERYYDNVYTPIEFGTVFKQFNVKTTNTLDNKVMRRLDGLAAAKTASAFEYDGNFSINANSRFSITQNFQTLHFAPYYTSVSSQSQYRLTTEIKDENSTIWRQITPIQVLGQNLL